MLLFLSGIRICWLLIINKIRVVFLVTFETTSVSMATFNQVGAVLLKKLNFFCFPLLMRRGLFPPVNISYRARRPKEETLDFPEILWKIQRACHPKLLTRLKRKVKISLLPNWCWIIQIIQSVKLPLIMNSSGSVTGAGWQPSLTPTEVRKFSFDPDS